jgi:uncharacterized protein YeaO (DUF488 family)
MTIHIVRLGSPRLKNEGLRIGTVRRPPRGVPKSEFASHDWYDVWYPNLSPSPELVKQALTVTTDGEWQDFVHKYRKEMAQPEHNHTLELLAALSQQTDFSLGCYCEHENRCHRSVLRVLLEEKGAKLHPQTH